MQQGYNTGNLYILSAPSGAGKTTLAKALVSTIAHMQLSISYTTRTPRASEVEGIDYFFRDAQQFQQMIKKNSFLEYAKVHQHYYGTSRQQVETCLASGNDLVLAIDWQGAHQVYQHFCDAIRIFILPPSKSVLKERLQIRNQDKIEVIEQRLLAATGEITHYTEFDYIIINDQLTQALQDLQAIIQAKRLMQQKQAIKYTKLLAEWLIER